MYRILILIITYLYVTIPVNARMVNKDDFKQLEQIYKTASKVFTEALTNRSLTRTFDVIDSLENVCKNDKNISNALSVNFDTCPLELRNDYLYLLNHQSSMRNSCKELSMSGLLQNAIDQSKINSFIKLIEIEGVDSYERKKNEGAPAETLEERNKRMKWWRDGKFGMFIHYGLYSGLGGVYKGKDFNGCVEWIQAYSGASFEDYTKEAIPRFNPQSGNARKWVELAKKAGCKYTVLTSRHHEGFNMFDTQYSDFNVKKMKGIDVVKEYSDACKEYGIKTGFYFSLIDWNHLEYDPRGTGISYPKGNYDAIDKGIRKWGDRNKYKEYLFNIFDDLCTNYHVDLVWWDYSSPTLQGDSGWGATKLMRRLFDSNPNAIQNNRLYFSTNHLSEGGIRVTPVWKGDYSTAEHHVPPTGIDGDWEACQTLNGTWGYSSINQNWKSFNTILHELVDVVSRGGNYLLNLGPMPDGSIPPKAESLFLEIGQWMEINGEAIYGTRANPFNKEFEWGRVTRKGNNELFLIVYDKPQDNKIIIPCVFDKDVKTSVLGDNGSVIVSGNKKNTIIDISEMKISNGASVIKLCGYWSLN